MTYEEFKSNWEDMTVSQREWVKAKARQEAMSCWSVMREWTVPDDSMLGEDGTVNDGEARDED